MTLTLELPEDIARQLAPLPEGERNHFAVVALRQRLQWNDSPETEINDSRVWWDSLTEAEKQVETQNLQEGLADIDAGRTRLAHEVYARLRARIAAENSGSK